MDPDIEKIVSAARAGGEVLKKYFGQSLDTVQKSTVSDYRTKADLESEIAILNILEAEFPDYNIFSEEKGKINKNSQFTFIVDPLDGTNNFVLGIPNFSISIGLIKEDEIIAGVIYSPIIDNVYSAVKGQGAYCDGQKLKVSTESDITKSTICYTCSYETYFTEEVKAIKALYTKDAKRVMVNWSPTFDFCMLASGRVEAVIVNNIELYDFAAGKIIAKEAGSKITDFHGNTETSDRNQIFILSNDTEIHNHALEAVKD